MGQLVPVTYREVPLVGAAKHWSAPLGSSVLDIVREVPELPCYFGEIGFVCVNGEEVPREWWAYVRPKAHSVVTLHIRMHGPSARKVVAAVAAVAVILIAAIAAPLIAGSLGLVAGSTAFLATQAAIGIAGSIGGALLYSALAPPPAAATAAAAAGPALDRSVKAAALSGNTLGAGDNLARVLGYRRVFPSFISPPVVELIGITETVEGVYGLAGPHMIDHIYAGDVDVATMPEVSTQVTQGFPNSIPQTLVNRQGFVVAPNTDLSAHIYDSNNTNRLRDQGDPVSDLPFYHRFVTRTAPDECWLSVSFSEGLIHTNGNNLLVPLRVRFRIRGTTAWTNCPEVQIKGNAPAALQVTLKLMWVPGPSALPDPDSSVGMYVAYYTTPAQSVTPSGGGAFTAASYFYKGSGDTYYSDPNILTTGLLNIGGFADRVEFYLDPAVFPKAAYEVEIRRGQAIQVTNWNRSTYQYNPGTGAQVYDLFGYFTNPNASLLESQGSIKHKASVIRVTSIWNSPPVAAGAPIATIAVKARGRSVQQLSCDAGGFVPGASSIKGGTQTQTFTNPGTGTFVVPASVISLTVEAWGGGGGGAGSSSTNWPGGGGGGYSKFVAVVTPGQTVNHQVGLPGSGNGTAGTAGQNSWVNPTGAVQPVSNGAVGGGGGGATTTTGGTAGVGSIGTTNFNGGTGAAGTFGTGGGGGGGAGSAGNGANAVAGSGGIGGTPDGGNGGAGSGSGGNPGVAPGGGGGGGFSARGADGAAGQVRYTWSGPPTISAYTVSQNPADHYYDVLAGSLGAFPLQASQVDNLSTWHNDCDANGYNINAVVQGMKQMDVLKLIAAAGYAKPIQSETWGVAEDKDRTGLVPTQIFTPRNLQSFQWTKAFHPYVDGLRVKFDDALNLYVETEVVVLDPSLQTGGVRLEDIRYDTIVQSGDAIRRGLFDLKQARERLEFYSGTADIENLVCRVGDLVGVNHDVLSSEVGYARVISTTTATGNLTGLVLDDSFPGGLLDFFSQPLTFFNDPTLNFFNKPERVGAMIRCSDGTFLVKEVVATVVAFGNALQFNGSTADMKFPNVRSPFDPTLGLTFSCRFKTSALGTASGTILGTTNSGLTDPGLATNYENVLYVNTANKLQGGWFDGAVKTVTSTASVNDGNWHNGLITILDGSVVQLWLDNISQGTTAFATGETTNFDFWVGHNNVAGWPNMNLVASNWFNGIVDDIRIWNRVLSPADISTVFHGGEVFNGLIFRCTMEDTKGTDAIGGHNATIVNGPPTVVTGDPALGTTDPTSVTFAVPFADPGTVVKNCLVGFGPLGTESQRMIVTEIKPKKDLTADITFVDEAPDLFALKPTTLLLHFENNVLDSSSSPTSVSQSNVTFSGTAKFGSFAASFNGSNAVVIATETASEFFSQSDFTVDWQFNTAVVTAGCMCHKGASGAFGPWRVDSDGAGNIAFYSSSNGSSWDIANTLVLGLLPADSTYHHFALSRQGNYFFFFLDGGVFFSFYSALIPFYSNSTIMIGSNTTAGGGGAFFNGLIDEFRYTNGLARWIATFVPPITAGSP